MLENVLRERSCMRKREFVERINWWRNTGGPEGENIRNE